MHKPDWWIVSSVAVQPKYRLGHPENYLFLLPKNIFEGSKYPQMNLFDFEKNFTDCQGLRNPSARHFDVKGVCRLAHVSSVEYFADDS